MRLNIFRRFGDLTYDTLRMKCLDINIDDLIKMSSAQASAQAEIEVILRLSTPLPPSLPPLPPSFNIKLLIITPSTLSSFSDSLLGATTLSTDVGGPLGKLNSQQNPIPSHVTGFNFDLDHFSHEEVATLIDTFPPARLSSSCIVPPSSCCCCCSSSSSSPSSLSSVSYEDVLLYDSLSEAIEHITIPSPSTLSSPLLLQSSWAKQSLTGAQETFCTVEGDEGEEAALSMFEEGREWREGEMERMEEEMREWKVRGRRSTAGGGRQEERRENVN